MYVSATHPLAFGGYYNLCGLPIAADKKGLLLLRHQSCRNKLRRTPSMLGWGRNCWQNAVANPQTTTSGS